MLNSVEHAIKDRLFLTIAGVLIARPVRPPKVGACRPMCGHNAVRPHVIAGARISAIGAWCIARRLISRPIDGLRRTVVPAVEVVCRAHVSTVIATHMANAATDPRSRANARVGRKGLMQWRQWLKKPIRSLRSPYYMLAPAAWLQPSTVETWTGRHSPAGTLAKWTSPWLGPFPRFPRLDEIRS